MKPGRAANAVLAAGLVLWGFSWLIYSDAAFLKPVDRLVAGARPAFAAVSLLAVLTAVGVFLASIVCAKTLGETILPFMIMAAGVLLVNLADAHPDQFLSANLTVVSAFVVALALRDGHIPQIWGD